ncbi:uncharacterized protein LOC123234128 [Gracilinanus agilis]|uniref:uncharacterized protein LOC123234128 n=1 Tax=Gracilinanus agilis TaxID=191870 RepID=UPI001CFDA878|nr:uncharacterized protein LOC123234128 [Gracilinanus agilis]
MSYAVMRILFLGFFLHFAYVSQTPDFWNDHVDYPRTNVLGSSSKYCNVMMRRRGLNVQNACLYYNTFIHARNDSILKTCANFSPCQPSFQELPCHISPYPMLVTRCVVKTRAIFPKCQMSPAVKWTIFLLIILNLSHFSQTNKDFWTLHVDYPKTKASGNPPDYCSKMLRQRELINSTNIRPFHTFIHESKSTILNICANSTDPHRASFAPNSYESHKPVHLTECCIKSCDRNFVCTYTETNKMSTIRLTCLNGQPDELITYIHYSPTNILINLLFGGLNSR